MYKYIELYYICFFWYMQFMYFLVVRNKEIMMKFRNYLLFLLDKLNVKINKIIFICDVLRIKIYWYLRII